MSLRSRAGQACRRRGAQGSVSQLSALGFVSGSPERQGGGHVWSWEVDREISVRPRHEGSVRMLLTKPSH